MEKFTRRISREATEGIETPDEAAGGAGRASPAAPSPSSTDEFEMLPKLKKFRPKLIDPRGLLSGGIEGITTRLSGLSGSEIERHLLETSLGQHLGPSREAGFLIGTQLDHIGNMAGLIGAKNSGLAILAFVETIKSFDVMDMDALTDEQYRAHQYQEASIRQSLAFAILNAQINLEGKVNRKAAASVARHFKGILDGQEGVVTVGFTNTGSGVARHTAPEYGTSKYKETSKLYNLHSSTLTNPEFWQDLLSRHDHESPDSVYRLLSANHISQENAEKVGILEALNLRADLLVPISSTGHAMMLQLAPRPAELVLEASLATHKLQEGSTCWVESLKQAQSNIHARFTDTVGHKALSLAEKEATLKRNEEWVAAESEADSGILYLTQTQLARSKQRLKNAEAAKRMGAEEFIRHVVRLGETAEPAMDMPEMLRALNMKFKKPSAEYRALVARARDLSYYVEGNLGLIPEAPRQGFEDLDTALESILSRDLSLKDKTTLLNIMDGTSSYSKPRVTAPPPEPDRARAEKNIARFKKILTDASDDDINTQIDTIVGILQAPERTRLTRVIFDAVGGSLEAAQRDFINRGPNDRRQFVLSAISAVILARAGF